MSGRIIFLLILALIVLGTLLIVLWPRLRRRRSSDVPEPVLTDDVVADASHPPTTTPETLDVSHVKPAHNKQLLIWHLYWLGVLVLIGIIWLALSFNAGTYYFAALLAVIGIPWFILGYKPYTTVEEGSAKFILFRRRPYVLLWQFMGFCEVVDTDDPHKSSTIVRRDELYGAETCRDTDKLTKKTPEQSLPFELGHAPLYYKRPQLKRFPRLNIVVRNPFFDAEQVAAPSNPVNIHLRRSEVLYLYHGTEKTLEEIFNEIGISGSAAGDNPVSEDFLLTVESGFYTRLAKTGTFDAVNGEKVEIAFGDVLDEEIEKAPVPCRYVGSDHGANHLWGGDYFVGLYPFFQLLERRFKWVSREVDSTNRTSEEMLTHVFLKDDLYATMLTGVEVSEILQVDLTTVMKIRIMNPFKAQFRIEKWLEAVTALVQSNFRAIVGNMALQDVIRSKGKLSASLTQTLLRTICNPKGEDIERRYGIRILAFELLDVKPAGKTAKLADAIAAVFVAKQEKAARITKAEGVGASYAIEAAGEAEAIHKLTTAVQKYGELGLALQHLKALQEMSKGQGKVVVVGSDIQKWLSDIMTKLGRAA